MDKTLWLTFLGHPVGAHCHVQFGMINQNFAEVFSLSAPNQIFKDLTDADVTHLRTSEKISYLSIYVRTIGAVSFKVKSKQLFRCWFNMVMIL